MGRGEKPYKKPHEQQASSEPKMTEAAFAARWRAGAWRGQMLRSEGGETFTLIYQGRPGGPAGPDFRDAVLEHADGSRLLGDIELHLRPAGWRDHGHADDPRYNGLALHITLRADAPSRTGAPPTETSLANGRRVPLVILSHDGAGAYANTLPSEQFRWPCADFATRLTSTERQFLLVRQGTARFERRVTSYREWLAALSVGDSAPTQSPLPTLTAPMPSSAAFSWSAGDRLLFVEIAEALGYGRDRAALRAQGERLTTGAAYPPYEPLDLVERGRAEGLRILRARWRSEGPLAALLGALDALESAERSLDALLDTLLDTLLDALTVTDGTRRRAGAVSRGRAKIVAANVVLPFLTAWAEEQGDLAQAERMREFYRSLPSLPSNQITREMSRQLGLARLPTGAACHQGLHHLWAQHCREKRCASCPCNVTNTDGV